MIIHNNTKFGKNWLSVSGDTERTQSDTRTKLQTDKVISMGERGYLKKKNQKEPRHMLPSLLSVTETKRIYTSS